jgi:mRNA-degrading endonuclease YafQ of YafQ-DinJ toxin-antitoxin module
MGPKLNDSLAELNRVAQGRIVFRCTVKHDHALLCESLHVWRCHVQTDL